MVRVAHISDTHLGYSRYAKLCPETSRNQREVDVREAYRRAVEEILRREVDLVVHSGDVFDTIRPATHVIIDFLRQTDRILREGIPYYGIAGNHETPRLRSTTAALEYANMLGARFAHGYEPVYDSTQAGETTVGLALVPHGAVLDRDLVVSPDPAAEINIMVTHGTVPGLRIHSHELGDVDLTPGVLDQGFDYVALGHYHKHHRHNHNSYYAGATERFSFAEADFETGFVILDFSGGEVRVEHVPLPARPMLDLPKIDARGLSGPELTEEIRRRAESVELNGAIVRLKVVNAPAGSEVDRELLRELRSRCLNFSLEISAAETAPEAAGEPATTAFGPLEEELRSFVEIRRERGELEKEFAAEFLERGVEYLRSAAEEERTAS